MSAKLLPCPFCGVQAAFYCETSVWWVRCENCQAESGSTDTEEGAAEIWNTRSRPVAGVEVKPLEWHGPDVNDEIYARSALCVYTIQKQRKSMGFWLTEVGGNYASIDEAKAAAAADYRQRILSALLPKATAPVVSEPIGYISEKSLAYLRSGEVNGAVSVEPVQMRVANIPVFASPQPQPKAVTEEMVERAAKAEYRRVMFPTIMEEHRERVLEEKWRFYEADARRWLEAAMKEA